MKAFLAHSSKDAEFVSAVAKELGRQFCVYDKYSFDNSTELREAILRGLSDTSLFVLLASSEALKSACVDFESEEAWRRTLHRTVAAGVAYLIDSSVTHKDLPPWLALTKAVRENSAKVVARDIRERLEQLLRERRQSTFVGRHAELAAAEAVLTPTDGTPPPRCLGVVGLPGIGRKSILRQIVPGLLSLRKPVEFCIGEGATINDICIIVADLVEPYTTNEGLRALVRRLEAMPVDEALARTVGNLQHMVEAGEYPVFVDTGGLLDADGYVSESMRMMLQSLEANPTLYLFLVLTRRPAGGMPSTARHISVAPMPYEETKRLLSALATKQGVTVSPSQLSDLATYVAGYPPAAVFAIQQANYYGVNVVIADKSRLVQFRTSVFLKYLKKVALTDVDGKLMVLLAFYSPLPLSVLSGVMDTPEQDLAVSVVKLMDLSLVVTDDGCTYSIAAPVAPATTSAFGLPDISAHRKVAEALDALLSDKAELAGRLTLSRLLFRAASMAHDRGIADRTVHLATDLIALAVELYHRREYGEAEQTARLALSKRPGSIDARSYLVQALIHLGRWEEAQREIEALAPSVKKADTLYLSGFLNRKRGRLRDAIADYTKAFELGRRGAAVHRELAHCHLLTGDLDMAEKFVAEASRRSPDNPHVLNLAVRIAIQRNDLPKARKLLAPLEVLAPSLFYHRLSRLEYIAGRLGMAEDAAKLAVESENSPPFEVRAQYVFCLMLNGKMDEAERLLRILDGQFATVHDDIRLGLKCRIEILRRSFQHALQLSGAIKDKTKRVHKALRRDALAGVLLTDAVPDELRLQYETEEKSLREELRDLDANRLMSDQLDVGR